MKKIINKTHLEGYVFGHTLEHKVSGEQSKNPGTEYIAGALEIATDDEGLNVVPVTFRYVTAKTKAGKDNATYKTLAALIASKGETFQDVGTAATKVRVDSATGVNDFYNRDGELVTYKLTDGGFVHVVQNFTSDRNSFEMDVLIHGVTIKDADEDRGLEEMGVIHGYTFNFRNDILPVDLVIKNKQGMEYFDGLGATAGEPVFMKVWGNVVASTIETETVEESAFGADAVKISTRRLREWVVTGAAAAPYDFGDEAVMTADEVKTAMANRATYLADVKQRHEDYVASQANATPAATGTTKAPVDKSFNF